MKASVCAKEYASTLCDLFLYRFFFSESIRRGNYLYTPGGTEHTQITTHLLAPLPVNVNVFACLLCSITNLNGSTYTVELWMYVFLENC